MKKTKLLLSFMCVALVATLVIVSIPFSDNTVYASYRDPETDDTVVSIKGKISDTESKIKSLEKSINATSSDITKQQENKEYLDQKLILVSESISLAKQLIEEYDNAIAKIEGNIINLESEIDDKYDDFGEWMRAFYVTGDISYLQMILDSDNFNDALTTTEYIAEIMNSNNDFMDELEEDCKELLAQKEQLEEYKADQELTESNLEVQQQEYELLSAQSADYLNKLRKQQITQQSEYQAMKQAEEELSKELEEELALIAKQNAVYIGGDFIWPLDTCYSRVSSPFGWRVIFGESEHHDGIDIPCNLGSNVYAVNSGTVIRARWHSGYGYYVMIDHGGGIATICAHNSQLLVTEGQTVNKGDVIALAGTTGRSTGVHVHLEIRVNGTPVDPLEKYFVQP